MRPWLRNKRKEKSKKTTPFEPIEDHRFDIEIDDMPADKNAIELDEPIPIVPNWHPTDIAALLSILNH